MRGTGNCDCPWSMDSIECVSLRLFSSDASMVSTAVARHLDHGLAGKLVALRPTKRLAIFATGISMNTDLAVLQPVLLSW